MKDDSSEIISKNILNWLTGIITLAAALSTVIGVFFSDDKKAQQFAYIAAFVLIVVSGAIYFFQRRHAAKLKIAESSEPLSASAALRGLLPFEDGDELPGRARDVQEIYTLVASSAFRFGVLWGESGCGKTSIMRAGLTPKLRNEKYLPIYIGKPTKDPQKAIRSALTKEMPDLETRVEKNLNSLLKGAAPKGKKIVILFDQFEEFFLTNRTPSSRANFVKWLGEAVNDEDLPVAFLIGIRADFFAQLQNFAPQIPEPTSARSTYQLQNFDTEQAKQIFSAAAKADGIPFESALIQAVVKELETEEFIRPAELQVVGTRLKRKNIFTLNKYEALGGARGILSSYISEEIKQSPNEQSARLILRLMCADVVETKSQIDLSLDDILHSVSGIEQPSGEKAAGRPDEIQAILKQFVNARVLIHTDDDKYNLVHDYLAPYVRTATEGTQTNVERANRLLKRYVAEYKEDPKTRIPFGRVRSIQKYASTDVKSKDKAQELIKKSRRTFYALGTAFVMPLIILLGVYFFYLTQAYYFSIDNSFIVLRAGSPQFTFLPGFGKVVIQTDFKRENLIDDGTRNEIDQGQVTGFWFNHTDGEYELWGKQLETRLDPVSQARLLRWLGYPEKAVEVLIETISNSTEDSPQRSAASDVLFIFIQFRPQLVTTDMLQTVFYSRPSSSPVLLDRWISLMGSLAQARPEAVTSDMLQTMINISWYGQEELAQARPEAITSDMLRSTLAIVTDPAIDSSQRSSAIRVLSSLAQARPEAITSGMLQTIMAFVTDPAIDSSQRASAISALSSLAQARPEDITSGMLQTIMAFITNPAIDSFQRSSSIGALSSLAQAQPEAVTSDMLQSMIAIVTDPTADFSLRSSAIDALSTLAQDSPQIVTSDILRSMMVIVTNPAIASSQRSLAINAVITLAQVRPEAVTSDMGQSMMAFITNPTVDSSSHIQVLRALTVLAQARPQTVTSDLLHSIMGIITDPEIDSYQRSLAKGVLAELAQARPEIITKKMLQSIIAIVTDPATDFSQRSSSISVLSSLAQAQPEAVTSDMLQSMIAIVTDPTANFPQRSLAVSALSNLAQAQPEVVTSDMFQSMMVIITDPVAHPSRRSSAISALASLAQAQPEAVTLDMLQIMISIATDLTAEFPHPQRSSAISALASLAQAQPEAVNSHMLQLMIVIITDPITDSSLRSSAIDALADIAQTNPQAVTSDILQSMMAFITNPTTDSSLRSSAIDALADIAPTNPQAVTSDILQSMMAFIINPTTDSSLRSSAISAMATLAHARPQAVTSDILKSLITLVRLEANGSEKISAHLIFEIGLRDVYLKNLIGKELTELQVSSQPQIRISASQILEMLAVADLAEEARFNPGQIKEIKSRLGYLIYKGSSLNEDSLSFAAQIVLNEIERMESEIK